MVEWPRVAVGAVVLRDGRILLIKRKYPPSPNLWSIPGGHIEAGEPVLTALFRELEEETSLKASKASLLAITEYIRLRKDYSVKYHYVILDYLITDAEGEPVANEESLGIGFFKFEDALKLELTDTTKELIRLIMCEGVDKVKHIVNVVYE
ncbi:MAG: NUDIX hydrolase [Desulfurococcaceae archaeon]|nr:NUDIX hydrolase [Desulfurococcaceae archaeon]